MYTHKHAELIPGLNFAILPQIRYQLEILNHDMSEKVETSFTEGVGRLWFSMIVSF